MCEEKCANCKYYKAIYVPPIDLFKAVPRDVYVCCLFPEESKQVQWLGRQDEGAGEGMCEMFDCNRKEDRTEEQNSLKLRWIVDGSYGYDNGQDITTQGCCIAKDFIEAGRLFLDYGWKRIDKVLRCDGIVYGDDVESGIC